MTKVITALQAMSHPTVVATINCLSEMGQRLQDENDELKAALVEEREAILELVDSYAKNNTDLVDAIRARGQA
jgi:hypothetical protein